jgi:hypothetical protein
VGLQNGEGLNEAKPKRMKMNWAFFIEFWKASLFKILQHAIDYIAAIGQFLLIIFPVQSATNSDIFQTTNSDIKM